MNWVRLTLRAMFVALVLSLGIATAAQAAEGPFYQVSGGPLRTGKAEELKASAKGSQVLKAGGITLTCEKLTLKAGAQIEGVVPGNGGKSTQTIEYSGCKVTGNGGNCKPIGEAFTTKALIAKLGYEMPFRKGKLDELLAPKEGNEFAVVKFEGAECKVAETTVKLKAGGSGIVFEVMNSKGTTIEVGKEAEAETVVLKSPAANLKKIIVEENNKEVEKTAGIEAFGLAAEYEGLASLSLTSKAGWGPFTTQIEEETPRYISGGKEIATEQNGKGTIGEFLLEVPGLTFAIGCTGVDSKVKIGAKWNAKLTIEFTACAVVGRPECKVVEPIALPLLAQLIFKGGKKGEEVQEIFYSEKEGKFAGGLWAEVEILNNGAETCPATIKGKYKITGSAIATLSPSKPGETAEKTNITFKGSAGPTGEYFNLKSGKKEKAGTLTVNEKAATLKGEISQELESKALYGTE